MGVAIVGITTLVTDLIGAVKLLSSGGKKAMKGTVGMVILAAAIAILASVCKDLAVLNWEELGKGLTGVGILLAEVVGFMNLAKFGKTSMSTAVGMIAIAAAIKILASACADFGSMSWEEIGKGLASIGSLLIMLALFTNLTGNAKHVVSTGLALVLIGAAMKILASAMSDFGAMSWEEITKGLIAMAGALAAITLAVNLMPKDLVGKGIGLIAIATAMVILTSALNGMGGMSWEEIGKSMVTLAGSMAILAVGLHAMKGTLGGSAALLIASAALLILAPALAILGAMSWEGILKGLVALAGAFTVLGIAGYVLGPVVPTILALSAALALIGVGILAAAVGMEALAIAFGSLAVLGATGATAVVAALTVIITGVTALIPEVLTKVGEGIVAICQVLIEAAPVICEAFTVIIVAIVEALVTAVPVIVDGIFVLLDSVLKTIVEYAPDIIQAVFDILIACLDGIANNLSEVVQSAIDVVLAFLDGIEQKLPDVIQAGVDLIISFINGTAEAIENNTDIFIEAMNRLILAMIDAGLAVLENAPKLFKEAAAKIMNSGFVQGIKDKFQAVKTAVSDFINNAKTAITDKFNEWKQIGKDLLEGFIQGIKDKVSGVVDAVKNAVNSAIDKAKDVLGIHSPSKAFAEIGEYADEGLIVGLKSLASKVSSSAADVGKGALDAMSDTISNITDVINGEIDSQPVIRPVLDLSSVESGTKSINTMLSRSQAMTVGASMNKSLSVDGEFKDGSNNQNGAIYQFTQNNYSPKALSRIEIYRQTKNQFSALKEVLAK